ncbi:MAG: hypothetical protein ACYC4T_08560 [Melioribacteraceae bacterium]
MQIIIKENPQRTMVFLEKFHLITDRTALIISSGQFHFQMDEARIYKNILAGI